MSQRKPMSSKSRDFYLGFDNLNGDHPWSQEVPEGSILYLVRSLNKGDVAYFNYNLAKY